MKYVRIIPKKTHFIFSRLEKQKGPLWCIDTIRALLQGDKALSALFTNPNYCNTLNISASRLKQKSRFSEPCPEIAIQMPLNIR